MLFTLEMFAYLQVKPEVAGPGYHKYIQELLRMKVEGTVVDKCGLVLAVLKSEMVDQGKLQEGTGLILVPMRYFAEVLQPFKNEVIDCEVSEVNKIGFFAYHGPLQVFVTASCMPKGYTYSEEDVYAGGGPAYVSSTSQIKLGTAVRVRIIATKQEDQGLYAVGSINGDYLGPRVQG
mmetsp:Transcript_9420/g.15223  ORF Transcript_9420/g.15223 Transcript_9420/m.15223 type:complete len:177 (+) Transcript_9420:84-614(+)|eukprot:CAMPEP_0169061272 /NCGR_PEP_ID=MMETSP1015-20121227/20_1 /TAXON_ID=342587 /ORGANISM="Karlodinium micrum, Strain CCMP2283" /LENGTH=176 /DNA_ID=CAMNT_0009119245 /DNA_START=144 /DNA_END=674 /DNA_ORIENTATION=+